MGYMEVNCDTIYVDSWEPPWSSGSTLDSRVESCGIGIALGQVS